MSKLPLLLLAALAACAPMSSGTAPPAAPPAAMDMAPAAGFPTGVYASTLADADLPASITGDMRTGMVGNWEIAIDRPGHALVRYNGQQVVEAPFEVQGNQITFSNDTGQYACQTTGRYTWAMSGSELRFTRIEDPCDGRAAALTVHPWTKRP